MTTNLSDRHEVAELLDPALRLVAPTVLLVHLGTLLWLRNGHPEATSGLVEVSAVTLVLLALGREIGRSCAAWLGLSASTAEVLTIGLGLVGIAVLPVGGPWPTWVMVGFCALSCFSLFRAMRGTALRRRALAIVGVSALLGLFLASLTFREGWTSPWAESFTIADAHRSDAYFHGAVAAMIRTYEVSSTGLDGLVELRYYTLSHRLAVGLAELFDLSTFATYGLLPPLLFLPLVVHCFLLLAAALAQILGATQPSTKASFAAVVVILLLFATLLPQKAEKVGLFRSLISSQSYALGMIFLVCFWLASHELVQRFRFAPAMAALVCTGLVGLTKTSLIVVAWPVMTFLLFLRAVGKQRALVLLLALAQGLAVAATFWWVAPVETVDTRIETFSFLFSFVAAGWIWLWPILAFAPAWIALTLLRRNAGSWLEFASPRSLWGFLAWLVALHTVVGALPGQLFYMHGGSAVFFSEVAWYFGGVVIMALFLAERVPFTSRPALRWLGAGLCFVLAILVVDQGWRNLRLTASQLEIYGPKAVAPASSKKLGQPEVIEILRSISRRPKAERRETVLFVPRENLAYWSSYPILFAPLIAPAVAEVACINHLPGNLRAFQFPNYGFVAYLPAENPLSGPGAEEKVIERARRLGFQRLLILELVDDRVGLREVALESQQNEKAGLPRL